MNDNKLNQLSAEIIGAAIEVHKALGPGLLESVYETALFHELKLRGLNVEKQKQFDFRYKGLTLESAYRIDLLVEDLVILELKAVDALNDVHKSQALTYLKITGKKLALLINFNVRLLKNGIKRFKN